MLTVPQAAALWHEAGVSTIPILTNGSKRPAVKWAEFQARIPELGEIDRWWGNGQEYGLAVICGAVSGNLEMLELEARACDPVDLLKIEAAAQRLGVLDKWYRLVQEGYQEESPSGGLHFIYRVHGNPVPGNEKVARRPATEEELAENPADRTKVLAETRGEGGYVIVAPTSGLCHPSGQRWTKLHGEYGRVVTLTWETRCLIHQAIREALDVPLETPAPSAAVAIVPPYSPATSPEGAGLRPGDEWAARTSWADILEPAGWTLSHRSGVEEHWTRPGKSKRDGTSATVNYQGSDLLKVFSSSIQELDQDATYTKFGAFAALHHRGDHRAAAQELSRTGFGSFPVRTGEPIEASIEEDNFTLDDVGNGERLAAHQSRYFPRYRISQVHRYVTEEKKWRAWNGTAWVQDETAMYQEADTMTRLMLRSPDEDLRKHASKSRSKQKQDAMVKLCLTRPGMSSSASDFDPESRHLNLGNGVYDLKTGVLHEHSPRFLLTRTMGASYDPKATAPQWHAFLERALPDPDLQAYVQRCLGYTLLGAASERAMFVIYGPSGTGKSTFLETLNHVFGEYGETAPAGTFRASRSQDDSAATPALHRLKGKRFVTTSETTEGVQWNEELVKRYTGHDLMSSRGLYETFQTWRNEASIWMATNHAPRFTSDDRAIWNRVKLVPFETVFVGEGQIPAMDDILIREADGILNWLLEGLRMYREAGGLREPDQVTAAVHAQREQSDSVIRFLDDRVAEREFIFEATQSVDHRSMYRMYQDWCRQMGERAVGSRRFLARMAESGRGLYQSADGRRWHGVGRIPGGWLASG